MQYQILSETNVGVLMDAVNQALLNGWMCQGGLAVDEFYVYQAMVKSK